MIRLNEDFFKENNPQSFLLEYCYINRSIYIFFVTSGCVELLWNLNVIILQILLISLKWRLFIRKSGIFLLEYCYFRKIFIFNFHRAAWYDGHAISSCNHFTSLVDSSKWWIFIIKWSPFCPFTVILFYFCVKCRFASVLT